MTKDERTMIAAECAGIILGRIMRVLIIVFGVIGLVFVVAVSIPTHAKEPVKVEQPKPAKHAKKKIKHNKKCACKCHRHKA